MQTPSASLVVAGFLALSVSLPAAAAEKVTGINKDFQRLSETTANAPEKPGHTFKQITLVWKTVSSSPNFPEAWTSAVAQQDNIGTATTDRGYATNHYDGGDVNYFIRTVFNYPTLAEAYKTAAFDAVNQQKGVTSRA